MAYAEHLKSADTTGRQPMSMLEYEKIQQTDILHSDHGFADSLLAQREFRQDFGRRQGWRSTAKSRRTTRPA